MHRKSKQASSRIAHLQPPYKPDVAEVLQAFGPPLDLFRLFARRPARARGILGWGRYYLSRDLALTLRDRELVILRTTALLGAQYEWGVHLGSYAGKAVLDHGQIRSVTRGSFDDPCWSDPRDRAVLRAVDELCRSHDLSDATWQVLVKAVGEDGAIDLLLLCGWYHAISFVALAARLPNEPDTPAFADIEDRSEPGTMPEPAPAASAPTAKQPINVT
jgi:alkylhydroperoxidase family enzyme